VQFEQITCGNCGASVGRLWLTIVAQPESLSSSNIDDPLAEPSPLPIASLTEINEVGAELPSTEAWDHHQMEDITVPLTRPDTIDPQFPALDPLNRYQILEPLQIISVSAQTQELEGTVLDCAPLQLSKIEVLLEEMQLMGRTVDFSAPGMIKAYLSQSAGFLPESSYAYLSLYLQFPRSIPRLQDAWLERSLTEGRNGSTHWGLVLEDLSPLPFLVSCWHDPAVSVLQRLRWLEDMIELWEGLTAWGATASLINLANLRVDEGKALCLRRLHFQPGTVEQPGTLLANLWRSLLNFPSPSSPIGTPARLIHTELEVLQRELKQRNLKSLNDLQLLLADVIAELQQSAPELWFIPATTLTNLEPNEQNDRFCRETDSPTALLPDQLTALEAEALSDVGRERHQNEDYFLIQQRQNRIITPLGQQVYCRGLFILCDGMGGHAEGEVASALAAKTLHHYFQQHWQDQLPAEPIIRQGIEMANQAIHRLNDKQDRSGSGRMGTTLVMACVQDTTVRVAHVGDSRLYCFTEERGLEQLTIDHEVGQRDILRGVEPEIAYARSDAHQLTQALGPRDSAFIYPDIRSIEIENDALLLLCSDGLTDNQLLEARAEALLTDLLVRRLELKSGLQQLIDLANTYNGHDNITAILVRMQVQSQLPLPL
jgi:protein phosphatase